MEHSEINWFSELKNGALLVRAFETHARLVVAFYRTYENGLHTVQEQQMIDQKKIMRSIGGPVALQIHI